MSCIRQILTEKDKTMKLTTTQLKKMIKEAIKEGTRPGPRIQKVVLVYDMRGHNWSITAHDDMGNRDALPEQDIRGLDQVGMSLDQFSRE